MARQSKEALVKKRKRGGPKSDGEKGQEPKRQRSKSDGAEQPDEGLVRLLTGQDDKCEKSGVEESDKVNEIGGSDGTEGVADADGEKGDVKSGGLGWGHALSEAQAKKINVTVLLENANLETVKQSGRSGGSVLLNCDDHRHILKKTNREANDARPDITHQCLLALMDSPLNKAGRLKVYVRTAKKVLIEIDSQTRIPRTIKRFSGLMAELLEKFKVRGTSGSRPLLKVIRNPITSHLAVGTRRVVCTYNTEKIVDMRHHAGSMADLVFDGDGGRKMDLKKEDEIEEKGETVNVLYVVGAMAHGKITEDWADDYICVSEYPLSAATVCSRITYAYECLFGLM